MTAIGFVPARGGSARIPRKNLRTVQGVPLVARTITTLLTGGCARVIVSTDNQEIANVAELWGAEVDMRHPDLAGADVTVDRVVDEWLGRFKWHFDAADLPVETLVVVAQPTSPLLSPVSVANALQYVREHDESVFTTIADRHLLWSPSTTPLFDVRRNSTTLADAAYYRETGGLVVFDAAHRLQGGPWPPPPATMMELDNVEAIDIDDYADLVRARAGQKPARIQLRYVESFELGSGHRRRCETLGAELMGRHLVEVVDHVKSPLPIAVTSFQSDDVASIAPDVVVLDILDTKVEDVQSLYDVGVKYVITLEDLGRGGALADITLNELYRPGFEVTTFGEEQERWVGGASPRFSGPQWAVLRPEFQGHPFLVSDGSGTVVVSFGGTDPAEMTEQVVKVLHSGNGVNRIRVVAPPGRPHFALDPDDQHPRIEIVRDPVMAYEFLNADLAVTSSGRTVHEAAACGCPVVALAVNEREHAHSVCPGVTYVSSPMGAADAVTDLLGNHDDRVERAQMAHDAVDGLGAQRIAYLIDGLLGGML